MNAKPLTLTLGLGVAAALICACSNSGPELEPQPPAPSVEDVKDVEAPPIEEPTTPPDAGAPADAVLVTVNAATFTRSMAAERVREMASRQGVPPQMLSGYLQQAGAQLEHQAVLQFVDETLAKAEAARRNITVSDEEVDEVLTTITGSLPPTMTLDAALASQGMTLEGLRAEITDGEKARKLYEAETDGVEPVTEEQIAAFYTENEQYFEKDETVQASHILIECRDGSDEAAHATASEQAEAVRKQLEDGAEFAVLAMEKSSCPSKAQGGDLGSFPRGQMDPAFEAAAFAQELNAIGPVVKSSFGYHIIKVTDKQEAGLQLLEEVTEPIRKQLEGEAKQEKFTAFLEGLREGAEITYADGYAPVK